jgi:hypothetical protein
MLLLRDFDRRIEIRSAREGLIRVHRHTDAVRILRAQGGRPGLAAILRQVLVAYRHPRAAGLSDREVIEEIIRRLSAGSLQLLEMLEPQVRGRTTEPEEAAAPEEPAPEELDEAAAAAAPEPSILSALEETQIEGAEVLPEILQTLEQIDLTLAGIDLASVSLEPAPSKVPQISTSMQQVSSSVTATLTAL